MGVGPPRPRRRPDPVAARRTCRACRRLARCRRGRPEERRRRPGESEGRREREWSATGLGEWVDKKWSVWYVGPAVSSWYAGAIFLMKYLGTNMNWLHSGEAIIIIGGGNTLWRCIIIIIIILFFK